MNKTVAHLSAAAAGAAVAYFATYTPMRWEIDSLRAAASAAAARETEHDRQLAAAQAVGDQLRAAEWQTALTQSSCSAARNAAQELLKLAQARRTLPAKPAPAVPRPAPPPAKPAPAAPEKVEPQAVAQDNASRMLAALNKVRDEHGLQPLAWSKKLMDESGLWARELIKDCERDLEHDPAWSGGENLARGYSTPEEAVGAWAAEEKDFDYVSNTCAKDKVCGHWTQIVQRDAKKVGCQQIKCSDGRPVLVCRWDVGNIVGKRPF